MGLESRRGRSWIPRYSGAAAASALDLDRQGGKLGHMERLDDMFIIAPGPGDAAALAKVHVTSWRQTYADLLPAAYLRQMSPELHARRFRHLLLSPRPAEIVLAAERREGLVGYCAGRVLGPGRPAEVSTLYVIRTAQGLGLGRRLLTGAARVLQARGAQALRLWVLNGNDPARAFYGHLGGRTVAERPVSGWGGGYRETAFEWPRIAELADHRA